MRSAIFLILILIICQVSFAQEKSKHPIKSFTSEDGKLFWNKDLPVYLFVADNPGGDQIKKLESENQAQYANPVMLDTEGVNWIRTRWAVDKETGKSVLPQQEVMFEIYRDGAPPITTTSFLGAPKYTSNSVIYYGKELKLDAKVYDKHAGLEKLFYSANSSVFNEFKAPLSISKEGQNVYKFYGVDHVGNVESKQIFEFTVDLTAPQTTYTVIGDQSENILSPRTKIEFSSKDNLSGVKNIFYQFDDGIEKRYYSKIAIASLTEGEHKLTYYAKDHVGNTENSKSYQFFLDKSAPEVMTAIKGEEFKKNGKVYISEATKLELSATDNKAGVEKIYLKVDYGELIPFEQFLQLPAKQGKHHLEYYAIDKVSNDFKSVLQTSKKRKEEYYVDILPPTINHSFRGSKFSSRDTLFITSNTEVTLSAIDIDAGVKEIGYQVDNGSNIIYDESFTVTKEGVHKVTYYSTDQVGNKKSDEFVFVVDNTGPQIESILSMETIGTLSLDESESDLAVYSKGVKLYLGATDNVIDTQAIYYILNDGRELKYNVPLEINAQGLINFQIRAIDKLGNESLSAVQQIFVQ